MWDIFYVNVKMPITYEFIVVHSFGTIGGDVPGIHSILLTTIFWLPVVTNSRSWGRTPCFVVLTGYLFVVHFQLQ